MHYYKREIGEYYKKAGRLTMLQHGAYTMLMDSCYDREVFPTLEQAIDWCWASNEDEISAVKFVLSKFFVEQDGVFYQKHIAEKIAKYHENAATNKAIAIKREADKRTKREQTVNESPPNKEQLITNNKQLTNQKKRASPFVPPLVSEVGAYCYERNNNVDAQTFVDHYEANGWMRGKNKIKDWKACVRTWEKNNENNQRNNQSSRKPSLAERLQKNRETAERQIDEQSLGADGLHIRS